ncbi:MAG TPA: hypothetical protein VI733_01290 [Candidatus Limnocylindria bacterium]|nr:hypothetical protein [Candidatus Limnocylindria bacterium]
MTRTAPDAHPAERNGEEYRAFSIAVDQMRHGEQVVALINPEARRPEAAASSVWLSARLSISELPRVLLPHCDKRCLDAVHDAHAFVVLANLALDVAEPRRASWWEAWNDTLQRDLRAVRVWYAGSPMLPDTPAAHQLRAGTRLMRVTSTDPYWVHYDTMDQEALYRVESGPFEGDALIAASFGLSPLLPGLAGALIAPDHPPVRDPEVANRLLTAGWATVERGLPFEG